MDEGITVSDLHQGARYGYLVLLHFVSEGIPFAVQVQYIINGVSSWRAVCKTDQKKQKVEKMEKSISRMNMFALLFFILPLIVFKSIWKGCIKRDLTT